MSEFKKVDRCYHCGVVLQTSNKDEKGYINKETVEKYPNGLLLCNECYSKARTNTLPTLNQIYDNDFKKIIDVVKRKNALVVYVVDVFSFEGSFVKELNEALEGIDILAIANKADLLPSNTDLEHVKKYVEHVFKKSNLKVLDCCLVSSNTGLNIEEMYEKLKELSKGRDVYFIGAIDSGKSAVIKEFLKLYKNNTNHLITLYTFKDTTLRGYKIPIGNKQYIFETPGLYVSNSILDKIDKASQNKIIPTREIKVVKKTISKNNMLMLGGLCVIQLLSEEKTQFLTYINNEVTVNKTISGRFSSLEYKFRKGLCVPISKTIKSELDLDMFDITIDETGSRDLGILGLGWVSFIGNNQKLRIIVPKGTFIFNIRSKIDHVNK